MPFKSESQRRFFRVAEDKGILKPGTFAEWEAETPKDLKLPERLHPKKKPLKADGLVSLSKAGNLTAQTILEVFKQATVGRHEGYGATNSMVTADSGLLSASSLAKPATAPAEQSLPNQNISSIGKTPSSISVAGPAALPPKPGVMPQTGVMASGSTRH